MGSLTANRFINRLLMDIILFLFIQMLVLMISILFNW